MDIASVLGFVLGAFCLIYSIYIQGDLINFYNLASIFITLGGGFFSTIINFDIKDILNIPKFVKIAFTSRSTNAIETIALMVKLSEKTRREGLLAIEPELEQIEDPFIRRSLQLVVDGIESETIKDYMNMEINNMEVRHSTGISLFKAFGAEFPSWGMIGTMIGLIIMLQGIDDPSTIGPAMSVSLVTTFYGCVLANFICLPIADKLQRKNDEEVHIKELIAVAVISIQAGENPKMMEQKLRVFLSPGERDASLKKEEQDTAGARSTNAAAAK